MPLVPIDSLDDPRAGPYRNLKDKELARNGGRFIAEGENVVIRLLASRLKVESVLVARRKLAVVSPYARADVPVLIASDDLIEQIIGFEFHSGALACGLRPTSPDLGQVLKTAPTDCVLTVCQEITNTENLGSLIRISAAFGAVAVLLGERCCDPYFRHSVRVSMGTIFSLAMVHSQDLLADLDQMPRAGFRQIAAVLSADAEPLDEMSGGGRVAIVFGNEAQGLDEATIARCDRRVTIPMKLGTDSLNVAVAAGIFLYHFTSRHSE